MALVAPSGRLAGRRRADGEQIVGGDGVSDGGSVLEAAGEGCCLIARGGKKGRSG